MKRCLSSTAVSDVVIKRAHSSQREVYAVFEAILRGSGPDLVKYLIYKLDPVENAGDLVECARGAQDVKDLGQPVEALKLGEFPPAMIIFSFGSKIYFCGGYRFLPEPDSMIFLCAAYMFDAASPNKGTKKIGSMNSGKPIPSVFGPVNRHQFYVFSASISVPIDVEPSMEILDAVSDTWTVVSLPSSFSGLTFNSASALCGSNILLSSGCLTKIYVYSTITGVWRELCGDPLPFDSARNVGVVEKWGCHILLAVPKNSPLPELYSWKDENDDPKRIGPFKSLGKVDGLRQNYKPALDFLSGSGWGRVMGSFYFDCHSFCLVRTFEPPDYCPKNYHFLVDIFDISCGLDDGAELEVKAKCENALRYKYVSKTNMVPRHFHAVK